METSIAIARLVGPVMAVAGIGIILNHAFLRQMLSTLSEQRALLFTLGVLTLSLGVTLVNLHNVWSADWRVLITLLGWLAVSGGVFRLVLPGVALNMAERFSSPPYMVIGGLVYALYGAVLSYYAYLV